MAKDDLDGVKRELEKHGGAVGAYVNGAGVVRPVMLPVPYFETTKKGDNDDTAANAAPKIVVENIVTPQDAPEPLIEPTVSGDDMKALLREFTDLVGRLPSMDEGAAAEANHRLNQLLLDLKRSRDAIEAERMTAQRQAARRAQEEQGGQAAGRPARPLPTSGNAKEEAPATLAALAKATGKKVAKSASGAYMLV